MEILLIIALIIVLVWLSRALTRVGNYMTSLGESMVAYGHRLSSYKPSITHKGSPETSLVSTIRSIKEGENNDYDERVRAEIDRLTDPEPTDLPS